MKMHVTESKAYIEMNRADVARVLDLLNMAIEGFDRLDKEISTGGEMNLTTASKLLQEWTDMFLNSNWSK